MTASLRTLSAALAEFQKLSKDMQAQTMQIFLTIATNDGITLKDIEQRTGSSNSSVSRNVGALTEHGLIMAKTDPVDARVKRGALTAKGKRFGEIIAARLNGETI